MSGNDIVKINTINPAPGVTFTSSSTNLEVSNNVETSVFGNLSVTKSSSRYYSLEFPVALKMDVSYPNNVSTSAFNITNINVSIYKNNVLLRTLSASALNTPYGTNRNQQKNDVIFRGIGYQYYGQFSIPVITDILTGDGTDVYTFTATPTFVVTYTPSYSFEDSRVVINTTYSTTFIPTTPPPLATNIVFLNTTSSGYKVYTATNNSPIETLVSKSYIRQELDTSIPSINGNYINSLNAQKTLNTYTRLPAITTWTLRNIPATSGLSNFVEVAYNESNRLVASAFGTVTTNIMYSDDGGITWTASNAKSNANDCSSCKWFKELGAFYVTCSVGVGNNQKIFRSTDGITWTAQTLPNQNDYFSIGY